MELIVVMFYAQEHDLVKVEIRAFHFFCISYVSMMRIWIEISWSIGTFTQAGKC